MVSLKRVEKEDDENEVMKDSEMEYPWGLQITLDGETLKKLSMSLPEVGSTISFTAKARVTGCNVSEREGGEKQTSCSLQITDMDVAGEDSVDQRAKRMYEGE